MPVTEILFSLSAGLVAALAMLLFVLRKPQGGSRRDTSPPALSFLFKSGRLVDASEGAEALISDVDAEFSWTDAMELFSSRFEISQDTQTIPERDGRHYVQARETSDSGVLEISKLGDTCRLDLVNCLESSWADTKKRFEMMEEIAVLQDANEATLMPIWKMQSDGDVVWHNPAYEELYRTLHNQDPEPDKPLFRLNEPKLEVGKYRRVPVTPYKTRKTVWYDIYRTPSISGDFYSAMDADAVVRAEAAQRNFVQTLAKTFAHLPIGLAIFDENRQLMLFNPALIDLTGLGADFLSSRPNLLSFFDELRDRRLMPEPKNYSSWRQQIADLVAAAADGRYSETWALHTGRTYRVTGRPHPDGAIAFLLEDISAEVSMTRRFRAELELSQSVLDSLGTAVAVFSGNGSLTVSNASYRTMWQVDPEISFAEVTIIDCLRDWQARSAPSPVWGELRDFVLEFGEREAWSATAALSDGTVLTLDALPLVSGATMIQFGQSDQTVTEISPGLEIKAASS